MIVSTIFGIKVDIVKTSYPVLFPVLQYESIRLQDIRDIAPMKLKAIVQRGSKKDFYDIYFLLNHLSLENMISLFRQKFQIYDDFVVLKSLTYFEDAENEPDPILLQEKLNWEKIKAIIKDEVCKL